MKFLVDATTGETVKIGERLTSFRGEAATLVGYESPKSPASAGRVYVKWEGEERMSSYFPSVFNLIWSEERL